MPQLAFDTTGDVLVAALGEGHDVLAAAVRPGMRAQAILALAGELLEQASVGRGELDRVLVGVGPGSFTGARVGVTAARGLAAALGIPVAGVPTLAAVAWPLARERQGAGVWASVDARRGERFAQRWVVDASGEVRSDGKLLAVDAERLAATVGDAPHVADELTPAALLAVGAALPVQDLHAVVPIYGRQPDAAPAAGAAAR